MMKTNLKSQRNRNRALERKGIRLKCQKES